MRNSRRPLNEMIDTVNNIIASNNSKLICGTIDNSRSKITIECKYGHRWETKPCNLFVNKNWCPNCALKVREAQYIDKINQIVKSHNGVCLLDNYIFSSTQDKIKFICANGHSWTVPMSRILHGSWCPYCTSWKGEDICRQYMQIIFDKPFPKYRNDWLKNKYGNKLEFDGYCEELGIAFEHNGMQHYDEKHTFDKSSKTFERIVSNDQSKIEISKIRGIKLVIVPSITSIVGIDNLQSYLLFELNKLGIEVPANIKFDDEILFSSYSNNLFEIKKIAENNGGECLSNVYFNCKTKLKFRCADNHIWEAQPDSIKRGVWCPDCYGLNKTIEKINQLISKHYIICISENYINNQQSLDWKCLVCGSLFKKSWGKFLKRGYCSTCRRNQKRLTGI